MKFMEILMCCCSRVVGCWPCVGAVLVAYSRLKLYSILVGCRYRFYDENGYLKTRVEVVMVTGCFGSQYDSNMFSYMYEGNIGNAWNCWASV